MAALLEVETMKVRDTSGNILCGASRLGMTTDWPLHAAIAPINEAAAMHEIMAPHVADLCAYSQTRTISSPNRTCGQASLRLHLHHGSAHFVAMAFATSITVPHRRIPPISTSARPRWAASANHGCGWVRRASLTSGRAVRARTGNQSVQWSVPETEAIPSCELERLAWAADELVALSRERLPFAMLQGRVRAMPRARGQELRGIMKGAVSADGPELICRGGRALIDASGDGLRLARDLVVLPYQMFELRARGADAISIIAALWPVNDIALQCKIARNIGMAVLVEAHTPLQVEQLLDQQPDVDGIVLVQRDSQDLSGDAASFDDLYNAHADALKQWGVPLLAEAVSDVTTDEALRQCPSAHAVLCNMPPLQASFSNSK